MVGETSCEWAAWFKAHHESRSYKKVPSGFDEATWHLNHTALLNRIQDDLEDEGTLVHTEGQNRFALRGSSATLGGKPDLITTYGDKGTIYDAKTGNPSPSHHIQVMLYMYAIPRALRQYEGVEFDGKLVYPDHEVVVPSSAIDQTFIGNLGQLIRRLSSVTPARKVPSPIECAFCNLPEEHCPERAVEVPLEMGKTADF